MSDRSDRNIKRERDRLSKVYKEKMKTRWKEGKPRAYYPLLEDQESPMEIWIGDAVNMCTRCKGVLVFERDIAVVKDIITITKVKVKRTDGTYLELEVDKIRFDHRICSATHLFKRKPKKPFKF